MELSYITGNTVIANIYDEFNIKSDDFVKRSPNWIYQALRHLRHINTYLDYYDKSTYDSNTIFLSEFIQRINLLIVDNEVLINTGYINDVTPNVNYSNKKYNINNNIITLESYSGTYEIWFKSIPVEFDDILQMFVPKVPNKERVIENIKWYVLKMILSRGYIHPIYSLGNRNSEYDPNTKWQNTLRGAKHDLSPMTPNIVNKLSNIHNTFISKATFDNNQVNKFEINRNNSTTNITDTVNDVFDYVRTDDNGIPLQ